MNEAFAKTYLTIGLTFMKGVLFKSGIFEVVCVTPGSKPGATFLKKAR
jgi:hypothetical protein